MHIHTHPISNPQSRSNPFSSSETARYFIICDNSQFTVPITIRGWMRPAYNGDSSASTARSGRAPVPRPRPTGPRAPGPQAQVGPGRTQPRLELRPCLPRPKASRGLRLPRTRVQAHPGSCTAPPPLSRPRRPAPTPFLERGLPSATPTPEKSLLVPNCPPVLQR